jgi:hypothetical protein
MKEYTAKQAAKEIGCNYRTVTKHGNALGCGRWIGTAKVYTLAEIKRIREDIKGRGRTLGSKNKAKKVSKLF